VCALTSHKKGNIIVWKRVVPYAVENSEFFFIADNLNKGKYNKKGG